MKEYSIRLVFSPFFGDSNGHLISTGKKGTVSIHGECKEIPVGETDLVDRREHVAVAVRGVFDRHHGHRVRVKQQERRQLLTQHRWTCFHFNQVELDG